MRPNELNDALASLAADHRLRRRARLDSPQDAHVVLDGKPYLAFASNDYLGLARHPRLIEATAAGLERWGVGSGSAHLVAGHSAAHEEFEQAFARWVGLDAALTFSSGYAANLGVITALLGRDDAVFADKLNHASLNDGCLLSRATFKRFAHNDLDHLASLLENTPAKSRLIAVDAVYSMDGDEAPLAGLLELAERFDAWLYLDDAHGFGVFGNGRGSLHEVPALLGHERVIYMATLGKAAGVAGAVVAGSAKLIEWLLNSARTYVFTTAQPPALAEAAKVSLELIGQENWRRERLFRHIARLRAAATEKDLHLCASRSPIQPLMMGRNETALYWAEQLRTRGIWVPAIRPPTVPANGARLRVSLSAAHDDDDLDRLIESLGGIEA
jgi:8-amino-7-oxononanoate synthase